MKNNKFKQLVASSLVAMVTTGCSTAPAPWANGQGNNTKNGGIAHSHNGVVHSHPLPSAGIHHSHRQGGAAPATSGANKNGVSHNHQGVTHSHPLPSSGINHTHSGSGGKGSVGGQATGQAAETSAYDYGNYDYGNSRGTSTKSDTGFYDDEYSRNSDRSTSGSRNDRNDDYRYEDAGYGRGGSDNSSSSNNSDSRDYGSDSDTSSNSSSSSDYYTVKSKDTVFEVMRQTGAYWKDIIRLNDLKAPKYEIQPGQRLKLPTERNS